MARKRMLSPAFWTSGPVNKLSIPAMLTFAGLWCYLDDYGRGEDDAALIKAAVWPKRRSQSEARVAADLRAIAEQGLICRYDVGGYRLIHSPSWSEHQKISHATDSVYPPCPWHEDLLYEYFQRDSGGPLEKYRSLSEKPPPSVVKSSSSSEKGSSGPAATPDACEHGHAPQFCHFCRQAGVVAS